MKRIFFTTKTNYSTIDEISGVIEDLTLINFTLKDTLLGKQAILKEKGIVGSNLDKVDIKNLLQEMYLKIYNYNFIKLKIKKYSSISKDGFRDFLSNCQSELLGRIQSEKIENIDEVYRKTMCQNTITINMDTYKKKLDFDNTIFSMKSPEVSDIKKIKELELEMEKQKQEEELKQEIKEIEKIILKSLYYLQVDLLTLEELEELIRIYDEYITKIYNSMVVNNTKKLVRYVIHSICILEKIYMSNVRLKIITDKLKVFKILQKQLKVEKITYDILERELIKCLLFKFKEKYVFENIDLSFYLTTPLRMSCFSYAQTIITIDRLIKKEKELVLVLKESFTTQGEYNKYISGSKILNDSLIRKFSEVYLKKTKNTNQNISGLYFTYFKYNEKNRIKNTYSDEAIIFYEKANIEEYVYKEKILKSIELMRVKNKRINIILSETEDFTKGIGEDYVIHLNKNIILKNIQNMSLDFDTNKDTEEKFTKEQYISSSKRILDSRNLKLNNNYCLVKFLKLKNIENKNFYIFETQILLGDFIDNNFDIIGTHVYTFILLENDFSMIGKVSAINYLF